MAKTIFIILLVLLSSCDNSSKKKSGETDTQKETISNLESIVKIREFDQKSNLFLDFYQSMNPLEFMVRANTELRNKRLFYRDYKDYKREENDLRLSSLLDSTSFPNSTGFDNQKDFPYDFNSNLYFPINTSNKSYYANISTQFDSQELTSISLFGPCFFVSHDSEHEKNQRIKESEKYKEEILKMYSKKYGKPKITKRVFDKEDFMDSFVQEFEFDKNIYVFDTGLKTIEVSIQCCADFQTEIKYILTSEYKNRINNRLIEKNKKIEEQKSAKNKTLEEI